MDGLCSNLSVLGLSIGALVSVQDPEDPAEHEASAASHRSALKAYAFFLSWLTTTAEEEATEAGAGAKELKRLVAQIMMHFSCQTQ